VSGDEESASARRLASAEKGSIAGANNRLRVVAGIGVALILVAVVWLLTRHEGGTHPPSQASGNETDAEAQVWRAMSDHGLRMGREGAGPVPRWPFSAAQAVPGGVPPRVRRGVQRTIDQTGSPALRYSAGRRVRTASGEVVWLVPGRGVLCMFRETRPAFACRPATTAYRRGITLELYRTTQASSHRPTRFTVIGVAPDGVRTISARVGNRPLIIPVHNNTFDAQASRPIDLGRRQR
jgi:hypothetical protein